MLVVALIPARGGSVRVRHKNRKPLAGKPLVAWSIEAARESGIFSEIIVSTDDAETADIAMAFSAAVHLRSPWLAKDDAADIGWVTAVMNQRKEDCFAILRPTSPFRTDETIRRAWAQFQDQQPCDSLRAVEKVRQHPGKMWFVHTSLLPDGPADNPALGSAKVRERMVPVLPFHHKWTPGPGASSFQVPWHSSPTQSLPEVWVQNASLEIAWRHVVMQPSLTVAGTYMAGSIAGEVICPFVTTGWEGFDINTPEDWATAEDHARALVEAT